MKVYFLLLISLLSLNVIYGQHLPSVNNRIETDRYYPENKFIRDRKIKFIIDVSGHTTSQNTYTKAYDTLGRLIGEFNYRTSNVAHPYLYKRKGDTLIRLKYRGRSDTLYEYEKFIYNRKGQILSYLQCYQYSYNPASFTVSYDAFYYDANNKLQSKLSYYKMEYPGIVSEKVAVRTTALTLGDIIYFSEKRLTDGNKLMIGQHSMGAPDWRAVDTTIYDNKGRIIRTNSYADVASLGCPTGNQVNQITLYEYTPEAVKTTNYRTLCRIPLNDKRCMEYEASDKDVQTDEYDQNKLLKRSYRVTLNGGQQLTDKYEYIFYE